MVRYRSSSVDATSESMTSVSSSHRSNNSVSDMTARELFRIVMSLKDGRGRSFLHSLTSAESLALAHSLLQRAASLDAVTATEETTKVIQEELCQAKDLESGYTPLHAAIFGGNLAAILLLLRQAAAKSQGSDAMLTYGREERFRHRPMQLLQGENVVSGCGLVQMMVQAVDHEGLTPLQLLGKLQSSSLEQCRLSLISKEAQVRVVYSSGRDRSSSLYSLDDEDEQNPDSELSLLARGLQMLQVETLEQSGSTLPQESQHGCEVLTFGRANHCALGVPRSDSTASHPQRVVSFALSEIGLMNSAVQVAAAAHHSLVVTRNGELHSCGLNKGGRLGTGDDKNRVSFTRVLGSLAKRRVIHVAAAENHSLCVTHDGNVYGMGSNRFGQLGISGATGDDNGGSRCFSPRRVDDLRSTPCVKVAAGLKHSVALSRNGEVFTFGDNTSGQLGRMGRRMGSVQRVDALWKAKPMKIVIDISASEQSTLVLVSPAGSRGLPVNSIYSWGHGNYLPIKVNFANGRSGGASDGLHRRSRQANPVAIASAKYHNAVVTDDGRVFTFGISTESLGTHGSRDGSSSAIVSSPQLVEGMLVENGGGKAVSVSASEQHTAVVTSCGDVFSWGASHGKDVLGHREQRWQPIPKKISGIHRAVGIACAKEHNIILVGTSFPEVPSLQSDCSLESLAAQQVAHHVDLFNVVPVLIMAHRAESSLLKRYCEEFVRLNLDGVLTLARKSELNIFLNEQLADGSHLTTMSQRDRSHHPLVYDLVRAGTTRPSAGERLDFKSWLASCDGLLDRLPPSLLSRSRGSRCNSIRVSVGTHGRNRALSMHGETETETDVNGQSVLKQEGVSFTTCSERCLMLTANMVLRTPENVTSKAAALSKEIRSVRKRLAQIARLEDTDFSVLTTEQRDKMLRKPLLQADLAILEHSVEKVQQRMRDLNVDRKPSADSSLPTVAQDKTQAEESIEKKQFISSASDEFRCETCDISCPDYNSLELHRNGRKHRNRVVRSQEAECKSTADSIMSQKQRQVSESTAAFRASSSPRQPRGDSANVWGTSVEPKYRLPPPPHSMPAEAESSSNQGERKMSWATASNKPSARVAESKVAFQDILAEETRRSDSSKQKASGKLSRSLSSTIPSPGALPSLKSPPWASPVAHVAVAAPASFPVETPMISRESKSTYSLGDFMSQATPSKPKRPAAVAWSASPPATTSALPVESPSKSLLEIQQQEETFREKQDKRYGVEGNKWFIERKERAGSFTAIQEAERELRLQIEEQKQIEEQIKRDLEEQRRQKEASAKKRKGSSSKGKKQRSSSQGTKQETTGSQESAKPKPRRRPKNQSKATNKPSNQS